MACYKVKADALRRQQAAPALFGEGSQFQQQDKKFQVKKKYWAGGSDVYTNIHKYMYSR